MFKAIKQLFNVEECSFVRVLDELVDEKVAQMSKTTRYEEDLEECKIKAVSWVKEELDLKDRVIGPTLPSTEKAPVLELKQLPAHLKYAYLRDDNTLPVIISSLLSSVQEKELIDILKENEKAIGWTLADIKGISPVLCMHKINLEDGAKTSVEHQRRLNPLMKDVVKKEIIKWLDAGIVYPIADSEWISPVHCVPKKGGETVIQNENGEMITKRTVTGWRICIDYRKFNAATKKYHLPLPFIDQMLDRIAGKTFYCFLDGYSGYNQISIAPEDQHKTTFTCPFGTFAFRRMPFGLCNAPATFQRCMMSIFSDMVEQFVEVFMFIFILNNSIVHN